MFISVKIIRKSTANRRAHTGPECLGAQRDIWEVWFDLGKVNAVTEGGVLF